MTVQGTFIFLADVKVLLKGKKKHLAVFARLVAFQSSVLPWEKKLILDPCSPAPRQAFWAGHCPGGSLDPGQFGNCCSDCLEEGGPQERAEGGSTGIQTVGGGCKLQRLVWCLFCFSYSTGWGRQIHSVLSVWGMCVLEILNIPRVGLQLASEVPCLIQVISEAEGFVGFTAEFEFVELQWEFE